MGTTCTITEIIDGTNGLRGTHGITIDSIDNVYVTGWSSHNAFKITPDGEITEIINITGDGTNRLTYPPDIAVDSDGNVYVTGRGSNNVFKIPVQ